MNTHRFHRAAIFCCALFALQTASLAQTCYNNLPPSTPTSDFVVHANGTVTHKKTGLMWKVCSEGQTWGTSAGVASCAGTASKHDFEGALSLAEAHTFAGHSDWRMASVQELRSIVESCRVGGPVNDAINDVIFPSFWPGGFAWTGSPKPDWPITAWSVIFNDGGGAGGMFRSSTGSVRLVRGGQSYWSLGYLANGYCGAAATSARVVEPLADFCGDRSTAAVTTSLSGYAWQCTGAVDTTTFQTGATVNCTTPRQYIVTALPNPAEVGGRLDCMAAAGSALSAAAPVVYGQTATCLARPSSGYRTASISGCNGIATGVNVNVFSSGPVTANCTVTATFEAIPANGICGGALNAFSATAPSANLCLSTNGNTPVTQVGINWNWTCNGANGGSNATCAAPATTCTTDIDGDGIVSATVDALIHTRVALGMIGAEVLNGIAIPNSATRQNWNAIKAHLNARCGMTIP